MNFQGGEFSTGTTGNFQTELTEPARQQLGQPLAPIGTAE
jgi:hypothetical protein